MDSARRLEVVSNCAVGFGDIDLKATTERGICVFDTPVWEMSSPIINFKSVAEAARNLEERNCEDVAGSVSGAEEAPLAGKRGYIRLRGQPCKRHKPQNSVRRHNDRKRTRTH